MLDAAVERPALRSQHVRVGCAFISVVIIPRSYGVLPSSQTHWRHIHAYWSAVSFVIVIVLKRVLVHLAVSHRCAHPFQ